MRIDIKYIILKWYTTKNFTQWMFYFKRYTFIKGFNLRILGLHFNIRENKTVLTAYKEKNEKRNDNTGTIRF